jgi:hypothetical protein
MHLDNLNINQAVVFSVTSAPVCPKPFSRAKYFTLQTRHGSFNTSTIENAMVFNLSSIDVTALPRVSP